MNRIDSYSAYQGQYYANALANRKSNTGTEKSQKQDKTGKTEKKQVTLSKRAQALLEELKKKYKNMDFIVANYDSDEEASAYLSRGTKEYSVLIEPETLEEMAADEATKEKYLNLLDESVDKLKELRSQLGDQKDVNVRLGVTIDKNGTVSFFAELEKSSKQQQEHLDKVREEKHKKEAEEEQRAKRTRVSASTVEELLEKIKQVDWDSIQEENNGNGHRFECSV